MHRRIPARKPANEQTAKRRFRASKKWREFRDRIRKKQQVDPVTGQKLTRMANLHHKDMYGDYEDLRDEDKFVFLNQATHDCVHFLFLKSRPHEWRERLRRIIPILEEMEKYSENK